MDNLFFYKQAHVQPRDSYKPPRKGTMLSEYVLSYHVKPLTVTVALALLMAQKRPGVLNLAVMTHGEMVCAVSHSFREKEKPALFLPSWRTMSCTIEQKLRGPALTAIGMNIAHHSLDSPSMYGSAVSPQNREKTLLL
jgi:hypothetical protein